MAIKSLKASKTNFVCKIIDIVPDTKNIKHMIIAVQFDDGDPAGPWIQKFAFTTDHVITMEEFMDNIFQQKLGRPDDPYYHLKEWQRSGQEFELRFTSKIED